MHGDRDAVCGDRDDGVETEMMCMETELMAWRQK